MNNSVIIVEVERHVRTLLESALEPLADFGVEIRSAASLDESLSVCRAYPPTLMLFDAALLTGREDPVGAIRMACPDRPPRILALLEKGRENDRGRLIELGVNEVLPLPFDPDQVLRLCAQLLEIEDPI